MTDTEALVALIEKSGLKYKYIASQLGISYFSLNRKINNTTEFKTREVAKLCELLNIDSAKEKEQIFLKRK